MNDEIKVPRDDDEGYLPPNQEQGSEPTIQQLTSPEFNAIWKAIKGWDIERSPGEGYAGATGTDVVTILNALSQPTSGQEKS